MKIDLTPNTRRWLTFRETRVTATDISAIMGNSPWKSLATLYGQKKGLVDPEPMNEAMERGIALEGEARIWFYRKTGLLMNPEVVVCDKNARFMASLDGIDFYNTCILEIKCPGKKTIDLASKGEIPIYYRDQIQWQLNCSGVSTGYYCAYDGQDGHIIRVDRDQDYIDKMIIEAEKFLWNLDNDVPPVDEDSVVQIELDKEQAEIANSWLHVSSMIKDLEAREKVLRMRLADMGDDSSCELQHGGRSLIKMTRVQRKGTVKWEEVCSAWNISNDEVEKFRSDQIGFWKFVAVDNK